MNFNLPHQAEVNKFIPKNKFLNFLRIDNRTKQSFTCKVKKIIWKYKIAESTINIVGTKDIEEIQIFEIELKEKDIPKDVITVIDKSIPYPILYVFKYQNEVAYGILFKNIGLQKYYFSSWNEKIVFDFAGKSLGQTYEKLVRVFVEKEQKIDENFEKLMLKDIQKDKLTKDILTLENKIRNEKQFKKQVEVHRELQVKKKELNNL